MNQPDIFRLIYRGHSKIPPAQLDAGLGDVLRVARANNTTKGITGALLVYEDWFAQTLEGEEEAVRSLYTHIEKDKRHDTVKILEEGKVSGRTFSRWAMAMVSEHGNPDIQLAATATGVTEAASRSTTPEQDRILNVMRDATRGYGRGS